MKLTFVSLLLVSLLCNVSFGQDSIKVLSQDDLFWFLKNNHPVSIQAANRVKRGELELQKSKGQLDPLLFSKFNNKHLEQKDYYRQFSGGLRIPTWYAIDLNAGYEQNQGMFINPESQTATSGLMTAGVSVPIGQGLFIDKRRAAIKQAELFAGATHMEQELMLNNLYYEASIAYIQWSNHYSRMQLFQDAVDLASARFEGIKQSFKGGDIPGIDTLEAFIQVQLREVDLNQAKLNYTNATFSLSNFLWAENNVPLEITNRLQPPPINSSSFQKVIALDSLNSILDNLRGNHPEMKLYDIKLRQLDVERKWNAEQLKPVLQLKYNFLNEPVGGNPVGAFSTSNYAWGFDFSFPLLLRESRGRLGITKLSIQNTKLDSDIKYLELSNKIRAYHNGLVMLFQQIQLYDKIVSDYLKLLNAEKQKFEMGESSVFLINSRESAYVQAATKLIDLNVKYQESMAEFNLAVVIR